MSNRRRVKPEPMHAVTYSAVSNRDNPELIAGARKLTHDRVINLTGGRRTSGVTWHQFDVRTEDELAKVYDAVTAGHLDVGTAATVATYIEFLRRAIPDGALIAASVEVRQGSAMLS